MSFLKDTKKTSEEIQKQLLDEMPSTYQKTVGFPIWDMFRAFSKIFVNLWNKINEISNFTDIRNLSLEDLILFVYQRRGIVYKNASKSWGKLQVTNGTGSISIGDEFETVSGLKFLSLENKEVTTGDFFFVECIEAGKIGNVPENTIIKMPTTIAGIVSVTNPEAFTNGYEAETKDELYNRYIEDLQRPITSGNIYHYQKWAEEIQGVKKADVKPLWNGDNTVKVLIIDQNSKPASTELVEEVQAYIDPNITGKGLGQAPIGAYCTVTSATALNLKVDVQIKIKSGEVFETVKDRVKLSIDNYLSKIAFSSELNYVSYAQIGNAIIDTEGVSDYAGLLLNNANDNVIVPDSDTDRSVAVLNVLNVSQIP